MAPPTDEEDRIPERAEIYQSILGELRYIADSTRPDIVLGTKKLAAATKQPTKRHWALLKGLVRYQKNTRKMVIVYKPAPTRPNLCRSHQPGPKNRYQHLVGYADADFAGDISDRKSTTGTVHLFNNAPIAWQSAKHSMQHYRRAKRSILPHQQLSKHYNSCEDCCRKLESLEEKLVRSSWTSKPP